nr:replication initiation protein [Microvirus sp.]
MCSSKIHVKVRMKNGQYRYYLVPCGHCDECFRSYRNEWCFRLLQEYKSHKLPTGEYAGAMVTLTYNNENLPISDTGNPTLLYSDFQLFMKRLRINYERDCEKNGDKPDNIKYFCCGEYGSRYGRPHYHLNLFGLPKKYHYLIDESWQKGFVHIGHSFTEACVNYTTKYVSKSYYVKDKSMMVIGSYDWCKSKGVSKQFRHMSCGLGKKYLSLKNINYHLNLTTEPYGNKFEFTGRTCKNFKSIPPIHYTDNSFLYAINGCDGITHVYSTPILYVIVEDGFGKKWYRSLPRYYIKKIFHKDGYNSEHFSEWTYLNNGRYDEKVESANLAYYKRNKIIVPYPVWRASLTCRKNNNIRRQFFEYDKTHVDYSDIPI